MQRTVSVKTVKALARVQALNPVIDVPTVMQRYALNRWQRNGQIFHA